MHRINGLHSSLVIPQPFAALDLRLLAPYTSLIRNLEGWQGPGSTSGEGGWVRRGVMNTNIEASRLGGCIWTSDRDPYCSPQSLPPPPSNLPSRTGVVGPCPPRDRRDESGMLQKNKQDTEKKKKCVCLLERTLREQTKSHLSGMKVSCVEGYKYTGEDCIAVTFLFFAISKVSGGG